MVAEGQSIPTPMGRRSAHRRAEVAAMRAGGEHVPDADFGEALQFWVRQSRRLMFWSGASGWSATLVLQEKLQVGSLSGRSEIKCRWVDDGDGEEKS